MRTESIFLQALVLMLTEVVSDIYVPFLPTIANELNLTEGILQSTVTSYMFGIASMAIFAGPISDCLGRRKVMLFGMGIFAFASLLISIVGLQNIYWILALRFVQGLGTGIALVLHPTIIRDVFDAKEGAKILSVMSSIISTAPMIAPVIGYILIFKFHWSLVFHLATFLAFIYLIAGWFLVPETLAERKPKLNLVQNYQKLFRNPQVMGFSLISGIIYGALWGWILEAPFFAVNVLHISQEKYFYFGIIGPFAYVIGAIINRQLIRYFAQEIILQKALLVIICVSLMLLNILYFEIYSIALILTHFCLIAIAVALVFSNSMAKTLCVNAKDRGAAASILCTMENTCCGISALLVSTFSASSITLTALMFLIGGIICFATLRGLSKHKLHTLA